MASTDISTSSSQISTVTSEDHKRIVDDSFLNKMKSLVERLRLENATLKSSLDVERSGVRALKAQCDAKLRSLKTECKKREEFLEKQLRIAIKPDKPYDDHTSHNKTAELKKLSNEIQYLKTSNRCLQEKLKVAQAAESARAAELRAQAAKHAALENAAHKDARAQCHKLLEEIKSKERVIIQLRRETARATASLEYEQAQRMECATTSFNKKLRIDQGKEKTNREDLKTDIQHRKENFYRETPSDEDSAVSSAPSSLSPQPLTDMWSCGQCRVASERAAASARECSRLTDALRDARDQLELMEFRLLELEDAAPDKGARDNLTDSDSGCVSPGSRIKDSASPELKRMDSGYKSPHTPSSPCVPRRMGAHDEFKEDFARAQVLADILDSEASDSLRSNPVKDHLEQMILSAGSAEDRSCLEQVLILLYNYQALSSSVSDDECYQIRPKKCELRNSKLDTDIPVHKTQKAIATVTPYSQQSLKAKYESLENITSEDVRKPNNLLQESGIFEGVETDTRSTQTESDSYEFTGELNTEIQRLNSIREKLEKQGVKNRSITRLEETDSLECKCVKLGNKHKQYYERRLKFLEGKISIYEAAQDVKESKLAQRLQNEFLLENRIQELESQLSELQDKYERLEEDCCELEEIENDTRLHWQQLEMDYELCTSQLRDMTEQRECSRAQAERLMAEAKNREIALKSRENELLTRMHKLEKAVPALIAWNCVQVIGAYVTPGTQRALQQRMTPYSPNTKALISEIRNESVKRKEHAVAIWTGPSAKTSNMESQIISLLAEKRKIEAQANSVKTKLNCKIKELEDQLEIAKKQIEASESGAKYKKSKVEEKIELLNCGIKLEKDKEKVPADKEMTQRLQSLLRSEKELKLRIAELEKRETAYLEMLTQADDMWAEMEGGYKKKIVEANKTEASLKGKITKLETEKDEWRKCLDPLKRKLRDIEESESNLRIALDKAERDNSALKDKNNEMKVKVFHSETEIRKVESACRELDQKFKSELEQLRKHNSKLNEDIQHFKECAKKTEVKFASDLDNARRDLNRSTKNVADLEVTNSELKEEVESLEKQLTLTQKALSQCKRKCDEKVKTLSHELSIKTEELEEMRSEAMRQIRSSRMEPKADRTEYIDEGYTFCTAVPKKIDYGRMHHSMSYLTESKCSCPSLRSQLVGSLIEDLFDRIHNTADDDLTRLVKEIAPHHGRIEVTVDTKAKITNYLLMAISKELVRSIGDADAKTDTEEWQRAVSSMTYSVPNFIGEPRGEFASLRLEGNAGVLSGASRLASVSCACAAARLCAAAPELAESVKACQEEVLEHSDVKIMEEQLANAIESIVNCPSCALGTNAIVWSTDV